MMTQNLIQSIPSSILTKLYDSTGTPSGGTRGFILFFISPDGVPVATSKVENQCVGVALRKTIETFCNEAEESQ